ncbi:hypothetical protein ACQJBY_019060 [Aegilops geniculata]
MQYLSLHPCPWAHERRRSNRAVAWVPDGIHCRPVRLMCTTHPATAIAMYVKELHRNVMLGLGDSRATSQAAPPPLAGSVLAAAGAVSMSSRREGYGPVAALSACSPPGLRARDGQVIHQIGDTRMETPASIRRKEPDEATNLNPSVKQSEALSFTYFKGSRLTDATHVKPREPPDRCCSTSRQSPLQTSLNVMTYPAQLAARAPATAKENPEVGGGEKGVPIADAARPKPSDGETAALPVASPQARPVVVATQGIERAMEISSTMEWHGLKVVGTPSRF